MANFENALLRVKNKSYGVCNITGQLIRKERLLLVPHATKSVAGKQNTPNKQKTPDTPPPSSSTAKNSNKKDDHKAPIHSTDQITSNKDEEDKDIEFLQIPRDLLDIDLKDYLDFGEL